MLTRLGEMGMQLAGDDLQLRCGPVISSIGSLDEAEAS
jgi:hypothetical protein